MFVELAFLVIATGLKFPEGPAWGPDGHLYFTSTQTPAIIRLDDPEEQKWSVFRAGGGNGLAFDPQGRPVFCDHRERQISRLEKDGKISVLAKEFDGKPMGTPNDLVVADDGTIYCTFPSFTRKGSLYRISADGDITRLDNEIQYPNGLALRDGGRILLVGSTAEKCIYEFKLDREGKVESKHVFVRILKKKLGGLMAGPDGMTLDENGVLYAAVFGGSRVTVISPEGEILKWLNPDGRGPTNCCFGGKDGKTLFVTETEKKRVLAFKMDVKGQVLPVRITK